MPETLAQNLADFAVDTFESGIGREPVAASKASILDTIGVALAARDEDAVRISLEVASTQAGAAESTVLGTSLRLPATSAAMVNGTMAHALDFDDTHLPSVLHPSASVVPTILAVAEARDSSGTEALAAEAIGSEITCRLGMAAYDEELRNSIFFEHGLHATSICGTIGSAVGAALLMRADATTVANAIGIAASMGAGLLEANRTGGTVKRTHCGWAAHSGISAAQLAVAGLTGPPTVLEGRFGFFEAYTEGRFDVEALTGELGERWEMTRLFIKPYPTNHFTHAGIDGALALRDGGVDPAQITEIELGVPAPVLRTIAEPADQKARPES
ncbi:MAG: MmgE/PrpD family protein, partial [Acidimicrobiia bacterium]